MIVNIFRGSASSTAPGKAVCLVRAFLDAVRKSMRQIRSAIGATTIDPKLLTAAERLQYEGYLRREETNATILALSKSGTPIKQIVRQTGHSRKLVRQVIRGERP